MTTPTEQALAWNQARTDRSRALTDFESGMIERARQTVLSDLPEDAQLRSLLKAALANMRTADVRVKIGTDHDADKSEFGVVTLLAKSPVDFGTNGCRVALVKIACAAGVRRRLAKVLRRRVVTMDWFVREFAAHGHLVARAGYLGGHMLSKYNVDMYMQTHDLTTRLGVTPPKGTDWVVNHDLSRLSLFERRDLHEFRDGVYRQGVAHPKPTYRVRDAGRTSSSFSEERVWRLLWGAVGVNAYRKEASHASERQNGPSRLRTQAAASATFH